MKLTKFFQSLFFVFSIFAVGYGTYVLLTPERIVEIRSFLSLSAPTATPTIVLTPTPETKLPPTRISIPKIKKTLPVQAAIVKGNTWDLFDKSVAWLSTSAVPGEGNVILYAHDWTSLWADLYKLKPGDAVDVEQGGVWKAYVVTESRAVDQHDVDSILSDNNQLTLFTCEGSFDQKRRVVYAVPK